MSKWDEHGLHTKVLAALGDVTLVNAETGHHFGRPYMTAYQLAIKLDQANPTLARDLGKKVGGPGGQKDSLARYVANQLSLRIKKDPKSYQVEGAFLSNDDVDNLDYANGLSSTVSKTGRDLSIFRLRASRTPA